MSDTDTATNAAAQETATSTATAIGTTLIDQQDPQWLPARLARKEKDIAKSLGFESIDEAKAVIAKAKELEQAQLSEVEKLRNRVAELEPAVKERDEYRTTIAAQAAAELAKLTPEQREAVNDLADTPAKQLKAIERLRPTWAKPAEVAVPKVAAASTVTTPSAPPANGSATSPPNHLAIWESLKQANPYAAAQYMNRYEHAILELKKARA